MSAIFGIGNIRWIEPHDPSDKKYYDLYYRPDTRSNSTAYISNVSVVCPATANGCIYECVSGGLSGSSVPTFGTEDGELTDDGGVSWKCRPDISLLRSGDSITASDWSGTGCTIDNKSIINGRTVCRLTAVPANASTVTITNHITILRANGNTEERDRSIIITIKDM